mmetsp:Transcript_26913/g.38498  ORF Transcript_26913/g.38498 Transcript_26913/m.38498 type:complete len:295 (+) Transcript_26913:228-1112(+)
MNTNLKDSPNGSGAPSDTTSPAKRPLRQCTVHGCPTRGAVDETGTCSAHGAKRKRCKIEGCPNGVVQGGVCVKHGAKRRTCKYPGCEKNTKSKGFCSKHGPARKKCVVPKCSNVAVRGGRCKSHGAYTVECTILRCNEQAIGKGLCIKHYKEMNEAMTQNAVRFAQMRQISQAMQAAQGVQVPVAGLAAMNPTMNPTAAGLIPLQMQGMGMQVPLPFLSTQTGMPNQMSMPNLIGLPAQMQMALPFQMQMSMPHPGNGLAAGMGAQVGNDRPITKSGDSVGKSDTTSSPRYTSH